MLPFEWAEEDKKIAEKLNLDSPRDLEQFRNHYFVSEMMYELPIEDLKNIIRESYQSAHDLISNLPDEDLKTDVLDEIITKFIDFEVFEILNFVEHPANGTIWVELYSPLYDRNHGPIPLQYGIILKDSELKKHRDKVLELSNLIQTLFLQDFNKEINTSEENIDKLYTNRPNKDIYDKLSDDDQDFLKGLGLKMD